MCTIFSRAGSEYRNESAEQLKKQVSNFVRMGIRMKSQDSREASNLGGAGLVQLLNIMAHLQML